MPNRIFAYLSSGETAILLRAFKGYRYEDNFGFKVAGISTVPQLLSLSPQTKGSTLLGPGYTNKNLNDWTKN